MTEGSPAVIAVVDDEAPVRKALLRLLRAAGLEAQSFASGREFLDALAFRHYDCVVLDLHMPGMTGFDVQSDRMFISMRIPAVIITGHTEAGTREKCLSLGASAYLSKPFDENNLLSAIEYTISKGKSHGASPADC